MALIERLLKMAHIYPAVNAKHRTLLFTALNNVRNAPTAVDRISCIAFRLHCSECIRADMMVGSEDRRCSVPRIGAVLSPKKYCAGPCDAACLRQAHAAVHEHLQEDLEIEPVVAGHFDSECRRGTIALRADLDSSATLLPGTAAPHAQRHSSSHRDTTLVIDRHFPDQLRCAGLAGANAGLVWQGLMPGLCGRG